MARMNVGDRAFFAYPLPGDAQGISGIMEIVKECSPEPKSRHDSEQGLGETFVQVHVVLRKRFALPITGDELVLMNALDGLPVQGMECFGGSWDMVTDVSEAAWEFLCKYADDKALAQGFAHTV